MAKLKRRPEPQPANPYQAQQLPIDEMAAVYYRQSSEKQIGNVSTRIQTIDIVEEMKRLGWADDRLLLIDSDAGVSGSKKISERKGMSQLFSLIEQRAISLVASQDVDRFFRDIVQIETNIFIDACRRNNVQVMTPSMVFDFAHPINGRYHMDKFRREVQRAADYIEDHIKGRLVKSRNTLSENGLFEGRFVTPGYIADMRKFLPDGTTNPKYRKYVRFEPYASTVLKYFELFREYNGNLIKTWRQIEKQGPFLPPLTRETIPTGFYAVYRYRTISKFTGQLMHSISGMVELLTNVTFIGHWTHKRAIVVWNNHEAIIPLDLFMYAYNRLSPTDFLGDPNPSYIPNRPYIRHKATDSAIPPTYSGLLYSNDAPECPKRRLTSNLDGAAQRYDYVLTNPFVHGTYWRLRCIPVDEAIDQMLLERLRSTAVDEKAWQQAIESSQGSYEAEVRRIQRAIRDAETTKSNLIAMLDRLTTPEMIEAAEQRFHEAKRQIGSLKVELDRINVSHQNDLAISQARPVLETVVRNWKYVPRSERRQLFEAFASYALVSRVNSMSNRVTICWRDSSESVLELSRISLGKYWTPEMLEQLRQMVESHAPQVEIMRAFPNSKWRNLQHRYAYHFGDGSWRKSGYSGETKYRQRHMWQDTEEFKREKRAETASRISSTSHNRACCSARSGRFRTPPDRDASCRNG